MDFEIAEKSLPSASQVHIPVPLGSGEAARTPFPGVPSPYNASEDAGKGKGRGKAQRTRKTDLMVDFEEVEKFNPNHDDLGRFSEGPDFGSSYADLWKDPKDDYDLKTAEWKQNQHQIDADQTFRRAGNAQQKQMKLTPKEQQAVLDYTRGADDWKRVNAYLRGKGPKKLDDFDSATLEGLQKVTEKAKLPESMVLYRGARLRDADALKPGTTIMDKAFVSTSTSVLTAQEFPFGSYGGTGVGKAVIFRIAAPKGSFGLINKGYSSSTENEVILRPGSRFQVRNVQTAKAPYGSSKVYLIDVVLK